MAWTNVTNLKSGELWDYTLPQKINDNLIYIRDRLITKGYTVAALNTVDISAGYATSITNIKGILNVLEGNINIVNNALTDFVEYYYGSAVVYGRFAPKLPELNRWIDFCNDLKAIAFGEKQKTAWILKPTDDILHTDVVCMANGDTILINRGGYIG